MILDGYEVGSTGYERMFLVKPPISIIEVVLAALSCVVFLCPAQGEETRGLPILQPNFIVILTDDLRADCLGYAGNQVVRTPVLDAFAAESACFTQMYTCNPLCSPSRSVILSGLYSHQAANGILSNRSWVDFPSDTTTLASELNTAGYRTAFIGKTHLGGDPRAWGFQDVPMWLPTGSIAYEDPTLFVNGRYRRVAGNITRSFATAALRFLRLRGNGKAPWLLFVSTTAPHGPYCCTDTYPYTQKEIEADPPPDFPPGTPMDEFDWASYYATISDLDAEVGRILTEVNDLGLREKTYVLFTSDQGLMAGSHDTGQIKSVWFNEAIRVPGLFRGPGVSAGDVNVPVMTLDILPTLLELAGIRPPSTLSGKSLVGPILNGNPIHDSVFSESETFTGSVPTWQMVRSYEGLSAGFKYVIEPGEGNEYLYDEIKDPFELQNLLDLPDPPQKVLDRLRLLHSSWFTSTP